MKYSILSILFICLLTTNIVEAKSKKEKHMDEACVKKNALIATIGYGTPSIIRAYLKYKTTRDQITVYGSGPYILKAEYMVSNRIGISANASYSQSRIAWEDIGFDTIKQNYHNFEFGITAYEISGTLRGNYHFLKRKKLDGYVGAGIGYGFIKMNSYTYAHTTRFSIQYEFPRPLSLECTAGLRYFPIKNLGVYSEVGLGKSWILFNKYFLPEALIQFGIVLKLD
jgi:hypothetical protein